MKFERRAWAKALFGRPARLETAAWVLTLPQDATFSLDDAVAAIAVAQGSDVQHCLQQMVAYDMLERDETIAGRPRYRWRSSPLWEGWRSFDRAFKELEQAASAAADHAQAVTGLRVVPGPGRT